MPVAFVIKISGGKNLVRKLTQKYPARLHTIIGESLIEGVGEAIKEAIPLTPFDTFALRRSIRGEVDPRTLRARVIAGSRDVPYAKYQEFGTYANRINSNSTDAIRAAMKVGIPIKRGKGITPRLYLHRGVDKALPRIREIISHKLSILAHTLRLN